MFLDSPVGNVAYRTETLEGVTNAAGEYDYLPGETVIFSIGDLDFPAATASGVVIPLELAGTESVNDRRVVNIIRQPQTLDQDGDPSNGITINETAAGSAAPIEFDQPIANFEADNAVARMSRPQR